MIIGKCAMCGETFVYKKGNKKCCSTKCAQERNKLLRNWRAKLELQNAKRKKVLSIAEVNELARAQGMTYGEYLARTEGGMR